MGETIMVIFIFIIMVFIGMVFYAKFYTGEVKESTKEAFRQQSVEIANLIQFLPELQQTYKNITYISFDLYKIGAFNKIIAPNPPDLNNSYYYDLFRFSVIKINQIYPALTLPDGEWVLYNKTANYSTYYLTYIPIIIYDAVNDRKNFGVLTIQSWQPD